MNYRWKNNLNICHGKPCLRGLRYPVEFIRELLSSGLTIADILAHYDDSEKTFCPLCLKYPLEIISSWTRLKLTVGKVMANRQ
ncbi:MAG: DUF433 domain-containing protein [Microcystis sp. M015S2]|uniref:DUF433 domain-containing protein n=1 Tax=unclassified Microcystis TaxID=2643300 RepID=UPI0025846F90|nr:MULTISPECIES: DUF433 domain-containing protein [unclassified Microcystis]MCA2711743.1 DUF433 domain-containing protein [Microcystis sp. M025S2]MCA2745016.1 DUF433 domain-containing protein [Microcystis sp. M015S2]MCA2758756.1 DUF433 domain-containing protein [Microcystis sp. M145S2]